MNNIIIKYKYEDISEDDCFNDNQNECMTCSDNNNLVLVENNFCSCFKYVVFCETCFISWLLKNHKCFICRKKIKDNNNSIFNIIDILDIEIYHKILLKLENIRDNSSSSRTSQNIITNISNNIPNQNITNNVSEYYVLEFKNRNCYYFYILVSLYMFFAGTFCTVYNGFLYKFI